MDPDFLLLANALSALYLKQSEEISAVGRHAFGCTEKGLEGAKDV